MSGASWTWADVVLMETPQNYHDAILEAALQLQNVADASGTPLAAVLDDVARLMRAKGDIQ